MGGFDAPVSDPVKDVGPAENESNIITTYVMLVTTAVSVIVSSLVGRHLENLVYHCTREGSSYLVVAGL